MGLPPASRYRIPAGRTFGDWRREAATAARIRHVRDHIGTAGRTPSNTGAAIRSRPIGDHAVASRNVSLPAGHGRTPFEPPTCAQHSKGRLEEGRVGDRPGPAEPSSGRAVLHPEKSQERDQHDCATNRHSDDHEVVRRLVGLATEVPGSPAYLVLKPSTRTCHEGVHLRPSLDDHVSATPAVIARPWRVLQPG